MASKRRLRRRSCEGKYRHETRETAEKEAMRIQSRKRIGWENGTGYQTGIVRPYPCPFCGGWHVGKLDKRQKAVHRDSIGRFAE